MSKIKDLPEIEVKVGLPLDRLIAAVRELTDKEREFLIENLLATTNPGYLESIKEARRDYKEGKIVSHAEMFKK